MRVVYHCYGGSHSSALAAAIHVGYLDPRRLPSRRELMSIPYYDKTDDNDFGRIKLVGIDEDGNQVYCLGQMDFGGMSKNLYGLLELIGVKDEFYLVPTMPYVNYLLMVGGNLSRKRSLPLIGRPLIVWGSRLAYHRLTRLVEQVKVNIKDRRTGG